MLILEIAGSPPPNGLSSSLSRRKIWATYQKFKSKLPEVDLVASINYAPHSVDEASQCTELSRANYP